MSAARRREQIRAEYRAALVAYHRVNLPDAREPDLWPSAERELAFARANALCLLAELGGADKGDTFSLGALAVASPRFSDRRDALEALAALAEAGRSAAPELAALHDAEPPLAARRGVLRREASAAERQARPPRQGRRR